MLREVGEAAVAAGWRKKAADAVAPRVARSPLPVGESAARAVVGFVLLGLTLKYLVATMSRARRDANSS